jgi:hypothetical protein
MNDCVKMIGYKGPIEGFLVLFYTADKGNTNLRTVGNSSPVDNALTHNSPWDINLPQERSNNLKYRTIISIKKTIWNRMKYFSPFLDL